MTRFVVLNKAGERGQVAINAALVTYVRCGPGNFVDVHFAGDKLAVEGTLGEVVNQLAGTEIVKAVRSSGQVWLSMTRD